MAYWDLGLKNQQSSSTRETKGHRLAATQTGGREPVGCCRNPATGILPSKESGSGADWPQLARGRTKLVPPRLRDRRVCRVQVTGAAFACAFQSSRVEPACLFQLELELLNLQLAEPSRSKQPRDGEDDIQTARQAVTHYLDAERAEG